MTSPTQAPATEVLAGLVERVTFHSPDSGLCVLRVKARGRKELITVVELVYYKVRILTGGTEAVTRVLIESHDKRTGERWFTVGVSPNIVDASFEALLDSINYKLIRDGAPSP